MPGRTPADLRRTQRALEQLAAGTVRSSVSVSAGYITLTPGIDYTAAIPTKSVTAASNTTPVIVEIADHQLQTGDNVTLSGIGGNTAANGTFYVEAKTASVIAATAASPIVLTTAARHGYATGDEIRVQGVRGLTEANSTTANPSWTITVLTDFTFSLDGSVGVGATAFDSDGIAFCHWADKFSIHELVPHTQDITDATNASPIVIEVVGHGLQTNSYVIVLDVLGNTAANNSGSIDTWQITVVDADHFELNDSEGNGAYTSGGIVTPAFENFLDPVAGNGAYTSGGEMLVPGQITINAATLAEANARGFVIGGGLKMTTASGTIYGVITALPSTEGYPYQRPAPTLPVNSANTLSYAGAPLLDDLTALAVGGTDVVRALIMTCNHHPHYGSTNQLPLSQLVQGNPASLQPKWRAFGGGNVLGAYGKSYSHYYGPPANIVAFSLAQRNPGNTELNGLGLFSGGTVTIIPDRERPYNEVGVHTDGSRQFGALVTKTSGFSIGHPVTGLKGWTFRKMDVGTTAGAGFAITGATNAAPVEITTALAHTFVTGSVVSIQRILGNTAANGTWYVTSTGANTFTLDGSTGNAAYITPPAIDDAATDPTALTNTTPIVVKTIAAHGLSTGMTVRISGVTGLTNANGTFVITVIDADEFSLNDSVGNGAYGGAAVITSGSCNGGILETSTVIDGGTGTDLQTDLTSADAATPILVTCAGHGLSSGVKITIAGVTGNAPANATHYIDKLTDDTFELYSDSTLTTPVAGAGAGTGGYFTHGLTSAQVVLESLTMEAAALSRYEIEDIALQPFVNVDSGGQLVSRANGQRGVRASSRESHLVYNRPTELNVQSIDQVYNSRIEIAVLGIANRPGQRFPDDFATAEDPSAPQFLTCFVTIVVE